MIAVHSLNYSRSVRVVWLLEELGSFYELRTYERNEAYRAPAELQAVHPLGKSPVIEDGDLTLAESAAVLRYLNERYGGGRLAPEPGSNDHARHDEGLDSAEGSFADRSSPPSGQRGTARRWSRACACARYVGEHPLF
mgnify:CR=1 FL=1